MAYNTRGSQILGNFDFCSAPPRTIGANLFNSEFQNVASDGSTGTVSPLMIGTQYTTYDGRVFKYVELAENVALGEGDLIVPYTSSAASSGNSAATSLTDTTIVTATMASVLANQFRGGYLTCTAGTGIGQTRRVVGNTATTSGSVTFYLERPFATALSGGTVTAYNPYRVRKLPSSAVGAGVPVLGVSFGTITAATVVNGQYNGGVSYYGWMQTYGRCERITFSGTTTTTASLTQSLGLVAATSVAGAAIQWVATLQNTVPFGHMDQIWATAVSGTPGSVSGILTNCMG